MAQVIDPSQRPTIWQRKLRYSEDGKVKGFDLHVDSAYDFERLGWKHDVLDCRDMPGQGNCSLVQSEGPSLVQIIENSLKGLLNIGGLIELPGGLTPDSFDKRLVFDTRILGISNKGHEFTKVLTEREQKAVLEYLKTL